MFEFAIVVLFALAIADLIVGVSNDAVNFLNSSIGSRVAPRTVIMVIASLGMLAGVTFASGMMEVARKGIFHPQFFTMPELITIFLAVMLTDIILLDLYNTFGLPTSTTVSIVFELLGAAVAVSLLKILSGPETLAPTPRNRRPTCLSDPHPVAATMTRWLGGRAPHRDGGIFPQDRRSPDR